MVFILYFWKAINLYFKTKKRYKKAQNIFSQNVKTNLNAVGEIYNHSVRSLAATKQILLIIID